MTQPKFEANEVVDMNDPRLHTLRVDEMPWHSHGVADQTKQSVIPLQLRQWAIEQAIKANAGHPIGVAQQILDFVLGK